MHISYNMCNYVHNNITMLQDTPMFSVSSETPLANVLRSWSGIIIDEAVMLQKFY